MIVGMIKSHPAHQLGVGTAAACGTDPSRSADGAEEAPCQLAAV